MKEFYIDKDGFKIHAKLTKPQEIGEKCPLLIIVHGVTGQMDEDHLMGVEEVALELGFASLRVDMYGHGKSDGAFRNHTIMRWVDDLLYVIDEARSWDWVSDVLLAGHSQGGYTVMIAAAMKAEQIKALMPLSAAISIPYYCQHGTLLGIPFDTEHLPDEVELKEDFALSANYIRVGRTMTVGNWIDAYEGPVLLVHGTEDDSIPYECSERAVKRYKKAELVLIPGDGHCYEKHLDQVKAAVKEFLKKQL